MDIDQLGTKYYDGYEGEPSVVISINGTEFEPMEFWEGYMEDWLRYADLSGSGWKGFTSEHEQGEGAWANADGVSGVNPAEYLADCQEYVGKAFSYKETALVLKDLCHYLSYAVNHDLTVNIRED